MTLPYQIFDDRFRALIRPMAQVERLATGFLWVEGPVWFAGRQELLFSDIPNQVIHRLTPDGTLSVFRQPSQFANGHTRDPQGRLLSCEHGSRSVTRTDHDGRIVTLADRFDGKRLNSPNDLVARADGSIWFTDPTYGILSDYEGYKADPDLPHRGVYRIDPGGTVALMCDSFVQPNGLAFSPDGRILYVAESGSSHDPDVPAVIRAFEVTDTRLGPARDLCWIDVGLPDGFRLDSAGNLWSSAGDGVQVFAPDGTLLGKIAVPETVSNLCFGGPGLNRIFITATTSVYAVDVAVGPAA